MVSLAIIELDKNSSFLGLYTLEDIRSDLIPPVLKGFVKLNSYAGTTIFGINPPDDFTCYPGRTEIRLSDGSNKTGHYLYINTTEYDDNLGRIEEVFIEDQTDFVLIEWVRPIWTELVERLRHP